MLTLQGLSQQEAARRLQRDGPNALPQRQRRGLVYLLQLLLREPMFLILLGTAGLYATMGEAQDAILLLVAVLVVMSITWIQSHRTERALEALQTLASPRATVLRDGQLHNILSLDIVRGDIVVLSEGDRVPADAILRSSEHIGIDESLLTGESVPVHKRASLEEKTLSAPGGDGLTSVFSGTFVTSGQGYAEVVATGAATQLGQIGSSLQQKPPPTPLQQQTRLIVRTVAVFGLLLSAALVLLYMAQRSDQGASWREALLAGLTLAMGILPEEFPVVLTVFLALGARRLSHHQVLTRNLPAVETLGASTTICVDKTGTLTQNQMQLQVLSPYRQREQVTSTEELLQVAVLASHASPFDPMEKALHIAAQQIAIAHEKTLRKAYPLLPTRLFMLNIWNIANKSYLAAKGAPESLLPLCSLSEEERAAIMRDVESLAEGGMRVLAVAGAEQERSLLLQEDPTQYQLIFLGLLGFADPIREGVREAVLQCYEAGIRVCLVTGDFPSTAKSIAQQAGFRRTENILLGSAIESMPEDVLARQIEDVDIFARVVPSQKLRLVRALQQRAEVVAMTGDGVNDVPALQAAHIGIAMGQRGTDVAREAASLVLLDDNMASLVAAIAQGRCSYENIRKAFSFIVSVHVPIISLSMASVLVPGWPLLLLPVHIAFLELVIDPACSLVFEEEVAEPDLMQRAPRPRKESILTWHMSLGAIAQGLLFTVACLSVFLWAKQQYDTAAARSLAFASLVFSALAMILANRSWKRSIWESLRSKNHAFWWVAISTMLTLLAILFTPKLQHIFHFGSIYIFDLLLSLCTIISCIFVIFLWRKCKQP